MSITPKASATTLVLTEQMGQLEEIMSEMRLSGFQQGMSAIDAVNLAVQKEIDALKSQVATLEKTVEASQKALAESQRRSAEKPRIYAEKRRAEKALEDALQAQVTEASKQYTQLKESIWDPREREATKIQEAQFVMSTHPVHRFGQIEVGRFGYEGMRWVERYIGIRNLKRHINAAVIKNEAWKGKPFTVPYPDV